MYEISQMLNRKEVVLTGMLPHGHIVFGVFMSVMKHMAEYQLNDKHECAIIIADTEQKLRSKKQSRHIARQVVESVKDLIASGIDPDKTLIYPQSAVAEELSILCDHFRVMAKCEENELMMACDMLGIRANTVLVGDDQIIALRIAISIARQIIVPAIPIPQRGANGVMFCADNSIEYGEDALFKRLHEIRKMYRNSALSPKTLKSTSVKLDPNLALALEKFHERRISLVKKDQLIHDLLATGSSRAKAVFSETVKMIRDNYTGLCANHEHNPSPVSWDASSRSIEASVWSRSNAPCNRGQ
ncbi:MAG: hypothetical protein AUJ34_00625 [Parcubacteria group bacterium CG1_02_41_12]|nr:MAG: hypothetical protein AUJ34_00625 [Parcubacteria group bacterium CG1_02_41_12]